MEARVASFQKEKLLVVAKSVGKKVRSGAEKMKSFALDSWRYITLANELNYLMYVREKKFGDLGKMSYAIYIATNSVKEEDIKKITDEIYQLEKKIRAIDKEMEDIRKRVNETFFAYFQAENAMNK